MLLSVDLLFHLAVVWKTQTSGSFENASFSNTSQHEEVSHVLKFPSPSRLSLVLSLWNHLTRQCQRNECFSRQKGELMVGLDHPFHLQKRNKVLFLQIQDYQNMNDSLFPYLSGVSFECVLLESQSRPSSQYFFRLTL